MEEENTGGVVATGGSRTGGKSGTGGAGGDGGAGGATTVLKMMWWGNPTREMRTKMVAQMFQDKNPGIKIETTSFPMTQGDGKVSATNYWPTMNDLAMKVDDLANYVMVDGPGG